MISGFRELAAAVLDVLLDDACAGCGGLLDRLARPACRDCAAALRRRAIAPRCPACSRPLAVRGDACMTCRHRPPALRVVAPLEHADRARRLMAAFKYGRRLELADLLCRIAGSDPRVADELAACDLLVPVPSQPVRRAERGFDPAEIVARGLAVQSPVRVPVRAVLRRRGGDAPQAALAAAARRRAVRGRMRPRWGARRHVTGRAVLLVDDVVTTGATLREARRVVLELGAASVTALAVSRAPEPVSSA